MSTAAQRPDGSDLIFGGSGTDIGRNTNGDTTANGHAADSDMILQACVFEVVTTQVEQIPVPEWAFQALGQQVEKRNLPKQGPWARTR